MKKIREIISLIFREDRNFLLMLVLLILMGVVFFVVSMTALKPNMAVVKIGYSDIGNMIGGDGVVGGAGYRDGSWTENLGFIVFGFLISVMHVLISLGLYKKRGPMMARGFVLVSMGILMVGFLILLKIKGI